MEKETLLPRSQEPVTGRCPETDESSLQNLSFLFKIHFSIVLPSAPKCLKWTPPFTSADNNIVSISHIAFAQFMSCQYDTSVYYFKQVTASKTWWTT
jgi:hypothetical protein